MLTSIWPDWADRLPDAKRQELADLSTEAIWLAEEIGRSPTFLALVLEQVIPGHGDTLVRAIRKPYLLSALREQL